MSTMNVYFSPLGGTAFYLAGLINAAKSSVRVMAYEFTSVSIAEALVRAHNRGVDVLVMMDRRSSEQHSSMKHMLLAAGVRVVLDGRHAIFHNKVMLIDNATVVTGSYNFTEAAEHVNAENLVTLDDPTWVRAFNANFDMHLSHSQAAA